jgi:hypothetical protein
MADIEIYDIDIKDNWSAQQKDMFAHLEILTMRIIQKNKDITSNLGADYSTVYMTYATFGDASQDMFHKVCSLAKDYIFEV